MLAVEQLEPRVVLAVFCDAFAADVSSSLNGVQNKLDQTLQTADIAFPLLGSSTGLSQLQNAQFIQKAADAVASLPPVNSAEELETALAQVLPAQQVTLTPSGDSVAVEILLEETLLQEDLAVALDIGLPGLPIEFKSSGSIDFTLGYEYLLSFNFNCSNQSFQLGDTNLDGKNYELEFSLGASLGNNFEAKATLGFLDAKITDNGSLLALTFAVDGLMNQQPSVDLGGTADLDLHADAGFAGYGYSGFPSFSTDFVMQWDFTADTSPTVDLENIQIGLGDLLTETLQPLVDFLQPVLEPLQPAIDLLAEPVPVLSDLYHLITEPDQDITLADLAGIAGNAAPQGYQDLIELAQLLVTVVDVIGDFQNQNGELQLNLGDISINQLANGNDLRGLGSAKSPTDLAENILQGGFSFSQFQGSLDLGAIKAQIASSDLPASIKDSVVNLLDKLDQGFQYSFPVIDDPAYAAISLLMGNDFDLVEFKVKFLASSAAPIVAISLPIGLEVGLQGNIGIDVDVMAGYDTYGIRMFLQSNDPKFITEGFYLDKETHIYVAGQIGVFAGIDTFFFDAGVDGGLNASVGIDVVGLDVNGDGKVRRTENDCLFNMAGNVSGYLDAYVEVGVEVLGEFIGYREEFNLVNETLVSFGPSCEANPFKNYNALYLAGDDTTTSPVGNDLNERVVTEPNGILTLNIGTNAYKRAPEANPNETSEVYTILQLENGAVSVSAFGYTQIFHGVQKIVGDAGTSDDTIEIAEGATFDVNLWGGSGVDRLRYFGNGNAFLSGGDGDDILRGGSGTNYLTGGGGNDVITGGFGPSGSGLYNALLGGDGDDELYAGNGFNNWLSGDNGNDSLYASDEGDTLLGGGGDDFFDTGAGNDIIVGGPGDDRVTWKVGDGTAVFFGGSRSLVPDDGIDSVGVKGTSVDDEFNISDFNGTPLAQIMHLATGTGVFLANVERLAVQGDLGADTVTVDDLSNTPVQRVGVNLGDVLFPDGAEDTILIKGTPNPDLYTVDLVEANLIYDPRGIPTPGGITTFINPQYVVETANVVDDVTLRTFAGDDRVTVRGISGPTRLETGDANDTVLVFALPATGPISVDGSKFFATLDVEQGPGINGIFFWIDGTPLFSQETIQLMEDRLTADHMIPHGVDFVATGGNFQGGVGLLSGNTDDAAFIKETLPDVVTFVLTTGGSDSIMLSSDGTTTGDLGTIDGTIFIDAGSSDNVLTLVDYAAQSGNAEVAVTDNLITGMAGPADETPVYYWATGGTLAEIRLVASNDPSVPESFRINEPGGAFMLEGNRGDERVDVDATLFKTRIYGGMGDDYINIAKHSGSLDAIQGHVTVRGADGEDTVNIYDQESLVGTKYAMRETKLDRIGANQIQFIDTETVNVNMTAYDDVFEIVSFPTARVSLVDYGGDDRLVGPNLSVAWEIRQQDEGAVQGTVAFQNIENLVGGSNKDLFTFAADEARLTGGISGGSGRDTLDFSAVSYDVKVDFVANFASSVNSVTGVENARGGKGNDLLIGDGLRNRLDGGPGNDIIRGGDGRDRLFGGQGDDVLVGGAGNDKLRGGNGRDVLIGGSGRDRLFGGLGDDILIAGKTTYDQNIAALDAISREWSRTDLTYEKRVDHLRNGGGLNGSFLLNASTATLLDDSIRDRLFGDEGTEWFVARLVGNNRDKILGYEDGELIEEL